MTVNTCCYLDSPKGILDSLLGNWEHSLSLGKYSPCPVIVRVHL